MLHVPVLEDEALSYLNLQPGGRYIDATADGGGHAVAILRAIRPGGKLLAIEWDEELFRSLKERLNQECSPTSKNCVCARTNYAEIARLVRSLSFGPVRGVLFDLGLSSFHLGASKRGFSFLQDEPLDMRFTRDLPMTAADFVARASERELAAALRDFSEERFARRIARAIVAVRSGRPIRRTRDLVEVIRQAVPAPCRRGPIHFATRTFQALRIAVNHELENLSAGLAAAAEVLVPGGRIVAVSFHSLEDRTVKGFFRAPPRRQMFRPLLGKPLAPLAAEIARNPRARSARLRAFEKLL